MVKIENLRQAHFHPRSAKDEENANKPHHLKCILWGGKGEFNSAERFRLGTV